MPKVAVIIDAWESQPSRSMPVIIDSIIDIVSSSEYISCAILSSYDTREENSRLDTAWYGNRHAWLNEVSYGSARLQQLRIIHDAWLVGPKNGYEHLEVTHPTMLNARIPNKDQLAMHWIWELEEYMYWNPGIDGAYVFGCEWNQCCKTRPLGYDELRRELPQLEIFTDDRCILQDPSHMPLSSDSRWEYLGNHRYKMIR